jgi:hypothetical protein
MRRWGGELSDLDSGRVRSPPKALSVASVIALSGTLLAESAVAQSNEPAQPKYGWRETWSGADATRDVWLLYSGVTLAPLSEHIYDDGLRFRVQTGYGQYSYVSKERADPTCSAPSSQVCPTVSPHFEIEHTFVDALVGYHKRLGELTVKGFVGVSMSTHDYNMPDILNGVSVNEVVGTEVGVKGVIELWLNVGPQAWTSLDLSYTTAHQTGSARWRGGWRVLPTISIGPELRYDSNADDDAARAGAFIRYEWFKGEIWAAGGWAGAITDGVADDASPYGTVNVTFQF